NDVAAIGAEVGPEHAHPVHQRLALADGLIPRTDGPYDGLAILATGDDAVHGAGSGSAVEGGIPHRSVVGEVGDRRRRRAPRAGTDTSHVPKLGTSRASALQSPAGDEPSPVRAEADVLNRGPFGVLQAFRVGRRGTGP